MKTRLFIGLLGSLSLVVVLPRITAAQGANAAKERELIAVLHSDKPEAEKALACKQLSVCGSSACVNELAKLLGNERLASWDGIPLEAIPDKSVDEAFRKATESLQGRLLVGVINSIGVRRDEAAVELLTKRLEDKDADVASAAAVALGRIGTSGAAEPLRKSLAASPLPVRSAVAEGCVLCAERFLAQGNAPEATKIYDEVRKAEVPRQRMIEATRGAILARGKDGVPLLVEQLRSNDKGLFQVALSTARELTAREVDPALAAELEKAFPERGALIIVAMADRSQTVDPATILKAATAGHKLVRLAAIEALGRVGNATALAPLLGIAVESDEELATAAKAALVVLPGEAVDKEIVSRLAQADAKSYLLLIELVGQRRIEAVPALLKALEHSDRAIRLAALTALGRTVPDKYLSVLVKEVVSPKDSETAPVAQAALKVAAVRMPDRDACATEIAAALDRSPSATKIFLFELLGAVGGPKALATVGAAAKSNDPALQDVGTRVLGEWSSLEAAPVLLSLAKGTGRYQNRTLRGYIGMIKKFIMPDQQRAEMCSNALDATRPAADKAKTATAEQKEVLVAARGFPSVEMLKFVISVIQLPGLKEDATAAARAIAQRLPRTDEVRALLAQAGLG